MSKDRAKRIGSEPWPDEPLSIQIPPGLLQEFQKDVRVVVRHPWRVGIPVPDRMLNAKLIEQIKGTGLEVMLVPKG